jgi:hypothetical protein
MKKIILIVVMVAASFSAQAQKITQDSLSMPVLEGKVGIQEVVKMDSLSKKELYQRAKLFFVNGFKSSKDVIQLDDAENGVIIGKGISTFTFWNVMANAELPMNITIKIEIKDGRYRYTFNQVTIKGKFEWGAEDYWKYPKMNKTLRKALGEDLHRLENLLIEAMNKNSPSKDDKW